MARKVVVLATLLLSFAPAARAAETKLISTNAAGTSSANAHARNLVITPDGRYAVYATQASDATAGNAGGPLQIIRHDLQTGAKVLVSVDTGGGAGNGESDFADVSDDGRYVAFESNATDLVIGDAMDNSDVFLRDVQDGITTRLSAGSANGGGGDPQISANGRFVFFTTAADDLSGEQDGDWDLFRYDRETLEREALTPSNGLESWLGEPGLRQYNITPDGRFVVFAANNTNLVSLPAGETWPAGMSHVFRLDASDDSVALVDRSPSGAAGDRDAHSPSITPSGRHVAFVSEARNLDPAVTDTATNSDVFRRDMTAGVKHLSRTPDGKPGDAWSSLPTLQRPRVISDDGRWVAFETAAGNLFPNVTQGGALPDDVMLADAESGTLKLISERHDDSQSANAPSVQPAISADGRYVAFASRATDLRTGGPFDGNSDFDVFRFDRLLDAVELITISADGNATGFGQSMLPLVDASGRYVFFGSTATNLVASDANGNQQDLFRRDAGIFVPDADDDGDPDPEDNCPSVANPGQENNDGDAQGDACDGDDDNDNVADAGDNCPAAANFAQTNTDGSADGGDACDADDDNDGAVDTADNCPLLANAGQTNTDGAADGGDACDGDDDNDGVGDAQDAFPLDPKRSKAEPEPSTTPSGTATPAPTVVATATPTPTPTPTTPAVTTRKANLGLPKGCVRRRTLKLRLKVPAGATTTIKVAGRTVKTLHGTAKATLRRLPKKAFRLEVVAETATERLRQTRRYRRCR